MEMRHATRTERRKATGRRDRLRRSSGAAIGRTRDRGTARTVRARSERTRRGEGAGGKHEQGGAQRGGKESRRGALGVTLPTALDVAKYILISLGKSRNLPITTWKLQKLVYYSQAWASVWDDEPIFSDRIEAWANGPVCPALYELHRGQFKISTLSSGNEKALSKVQKETINAVLDYYGKKSAQYLSELSHSETPWKIARRGLAPGERGNNEISVESMAEYYGGL